MTQMNLTGTIDVDDTRTVEFGHTDEVVEIREIKMPSGEIRHVTLSEEEARYLLHYLSMIFRGELD